MTHVENLQKECFHKLKSIGESISVIKAPLTVEKSRTVSFLLTDLLANLERLQDPEVLLTMPTIQMVLIPMISTFKSMTLEKKYGYDIVLEPWLKIMHFILSKTLAKLWMPPSFTIELIILFTNCIDRFDKPENKRESSEEIKYLAVICLSAAFPAMYKEGRYASFKESIYYALAQDIRTEKFIPIGSTCITALLDIIRKEHNIQLRLESIKTLSQILLDNIYEIDFVARLLPGVVSKLCSIIAQKGEKENHQVVCDALDVLGDVIKSVMSDKYNNTLFEIHSFQDILNRQNSTITNDDSHGKNQLRTKDWYLKAKENIASVTSQILKTRLYPDWRSRLAFVEFAYTLLSTCARTLDNCIKPLVETLVLHIDDSYNEVSNACRFKMDLLLSTSAFEDSIVPILKDELYQWIMKFPTYMMSRDETEKVNAMSLIAGYIILLGDKSEGVLSVVLTRSSDSWMTALEIGKDSLHILEEKESERFIELNTDDSKPTPIYPRIRFKHAVTDHSTAKLTRILNVIGKYCDLKVWLNHFMRYISVDNTESSEPQAAYVIHALLSGASAANVTAISDSMDWVNYDDDDDYRCSEKLKTITLQTLKEVMDILTEAASYRGKSTALISKSSTYSKIDEESAHILTVCFGLQIVGLAGCILSKDCLQDQLISMLYPLLAHLGSSNVYVHTYALITLDAIALACGLKNAQELAMYNVDYIINTISQHISVLSENPRVPLVLKALIHVGGYASIDHLEDTILEIYDALDRYNSVDWICIQLCGVLFEIIQTLEKHLVHTASIDSPMDENDSMNVYDSPKVSPEISLYINNKEDIQGWEGKEEFKSMEEIGKYFLDRQNEGKHDDLTLDQAILDQDNLPMDLPKSEDKHVEDVSKEEEEMPLSKEEKITEEIMDKSSLFLTSPSPQLRSQILILLTSGAKILSKHPQELNKVIFNIWPFIVNRFDDPQNYVVFQAANYLQNVSVISTDFLSGKFEKDIWPRFKSLLRKGIEAASKDIILDYSIYSLYHRTQLCLLKTLTQVAKHVPMNQRKIKEILEETKYYYNDQVVHEQLANQCKRLFESLSTQQPDTVWLYQISLEDQDKHSEPLSPPSSILRPFVIPEWMKPQQVPSSTKLISMM